MTALVRVGDTVAGVCQVSASGHPRNCIGTWLNGSTKVSASNGLGFVCVGNTGITDCGHTFIAVNGSSSISVQGIGVERVGDIAPIIGGGQVTCLVGDNKIIGI